MPENGTPDTKPVEKKKNRRKRQKHPALNKQYNLKLRGDYIEPEYVNGVTNVKGELVIPPLDDEAKDFLNNFYEETVNVKFDYNKELAPFADDLKIIRDKYKKVRIEQRKLTKRTLLKRITHRRKTQAEERLKELAIEKDNLRVSYLEITEGKLLYPDIDDHLELYGENNGRNRCLFNRKKTTGVLTELNNETYDDIHDNIYSGPNNIGEDYLISQVDKKPKTILRKKPKTDQKT